MRRRLQNLNALRAFEAAARRESFKDAAEELNVTQSAVSHQIKGLEEGLGTQLFKRMGRGVRATDAALTLAREIGLAFDRIESAVNDLSGNPMRGTLRISIAPFYGNRLVLPRLSKFHALYPELTVSPSMSSEVLDLRRSHMDAGLRYGYGNWPGLTAREVHSDTLIPVAAPTVVSGLPLPLPAAAIAKLTLGMTEADQDDWDHWFDSIGYDGPRGTKRIGYENRSRVVDLAFSGHGVALADQALVAADLEAGHLVCLNPHALSPGRGMWLVYPETEFPDPRVTAFGDWFADEVEDIIRRSARDHV